MVERVLPKSEALRTNGSGLIAALSDRCSGTLSNWRTLPQATFVFDGEYMQEYLTDTLWTTGRVRYQIWTADWVNG